MVVVVVVSLAAEVRFGLTLALTLLDRCGGLMTVVVLDDESYGGEERDTEEKDGVSDELMDFFFDFFWNNCEILSIDFFLDVLLLALSESLLLGCKYCCDDRVSLEPAKNSAAVSDCELSPLEASMTAYNGREGKEKKGKRSKPMSLVSPFEVWYFQDPM